METFTSTESANFSSEPQLRIASPKWTC